MNKNSQNQQKDHGLSFGQRLLTSNGKKLQLTFQLALERQFTSHSYTKTYVKTSALVSTT